MAVPAVAIGPFHDDHRERTMVMTGSQKIVAAGAAAGTISMLVLLAALPQVLTGLAPAAPAGERLAFAAQWIAVAAIPLLLAVASVGHGRFVSEAIDPMAGRDGADMAINARVVDNSVQQLLLFSAASLAVAAEARGDQLSVVAAGAIIFVLARLAFWIGYRVGPLYRAAGFAATFYLNIILFGYALWLGWRS